MAVVVHHPDDRLADSRRLPDENDQLAVHLDPERELLFTARLRAGWRAIKQGCHEQELLGGMIAFADPDFLIGLSRNSDPNGSLQR
jgi:hypothetical protein